MEDYLDENRPGIRGLLRELGKKTEAVSEEWVKHKNMEFNIPIEADREKVKVWPALKWLTKKGSEARKVVMPAKREDGFEAWQMLSQAFEPYLASRQGSLLADFSGMAAKLAKTPKDARALVMEIERMTGSTAAREVFSLIGLGRSGGRSRCDGGVIDCPLS